MLSMLWIPTSINCGSRLILNAAQMSGREPPNRDVWYSSSLRKTLTVTPCPSRSFSAFCREKAGCSAWARPSEVSEPPVFSISTK